MSLAVSEFAMPCTVLDVERVRTLGETDKQRIALGAPLIIGDRCYRFNWDRQYAAPRLQCLSNQRSTPRRNRREEKVLADSLAGQLRVGLVSAVDLDHLHPYHTVGRNAALEHVAAGGLLQARGRACSRRFTVVVDRHGKAAWTTVSESRWPALKALWNWLRCLGRQGRREWRDERQLLQELRCLLPADQVKARRESIEAGRSNLMRGLDRQNPADVQDNFRGRIATPEGVMQFLRYDEKALERFDNDARTVLHHVACDPGLATGPVLDSLFMKIAIDALECRGAGVANARPGAAEGGETTPRIFASDYDGNTPVHLAVLHGDKASVLRFLRQAAKTDWDNAGGAGPRFAERRNRAGQTIWDCAQARVRARRADAWVLDIVREHGGEPPAIQDSAMEREPARGMPGCSRSRLTSLPTSPAGRHGRH